MFLIHSEGCLNLDTVIYINPSSECDEFFQVWEAGDNPDTTPFTVEGSYARVIQAIKDGDAVCDLTLEPERLPVKGRIDITEHVERILKHISYDTPERIQERLCHFHGYLVAAGETEVANVLFKLKDKTYAGRENIASVLEGLIK